MFVIDMMARAIEVMDIVFVMKVIMIVLDVMAIVMEVMDIVIRLKL